MEIVKKDGKYIQMSTTIFNQVLDKISKDGIIPEKARKCIENEKNLFYPEPEIPLEIVKLQGYKIDFDEFYNNLVIDGKINYEYIKELREYLKRR